MTCLRNIKRSLIRHLRRQMSEKIALISGFNGFIGTNLGFVLQQNGYKVAPLPRAVLSNPVHLMQFMLEASPTHVFHLASYGGHYNQADVDEIVTTNYLKTYFLLKASEQSGVENFINFSSSSVYGTQDYALREDSPLLTNTFYGATKIGAEYLTRSYSQQGTMKTVNIRPFSVYGEYEAKHRLIPTIIDSIVNQKVLTLFEKPVHDWIYIEDFLDGVMVAVDNIDILNGKSLNIGTGIQYTNKQIYDLLVNIIGKEPLEVEVKDSDRSYDTDQSWVADISLLRSLGWTKKVAISTGLTNTYEYYKRMNEFEKQNEGLATADTDTIMNTLADKFGTGWEDIPMEDENKIIT